MRRISIALLVETKFFPKLIDEEIEFLKDEKGTVTDMVLRQGLAEMKASRK
jgi:hypothetical protein